MYYLTGDIHGNKDDLRDRMKILTHPDDTLIIVGDFGMGFFGTAASDEEAFFDEIETHAGKILFLDGNHENFTRLNACEEIDWNGGRVHLIRQNLLHLMRGEVYEINGKRIFAMGGGVSMDRERRMSGVDWWPEEMPDETDYSRARQNLASAGNQVDLILTHTAPSDTIEYLARLGIGIKNTIAEEFQLTEFLSWVQNAVQYEKWYFGHFHVDRELWKGQFAVYQVTHTLAV